MQKNNFLKNSTFPALTSIINKFIQSAGITNIITTNYDRLIEYAADLAEGKYCTGFAEGEIRKFKQFPTTTPSSRKTNIFKVHGSIDWFKHAETNALYSLATFDESILKDYFSPRIVTPGISKYRETHNDPFRSVITEADKALRNSNAYLCIGYGFNDDHIQPIIIEENRNKNKPIVIVTKEITLKIKKIFLSGSGNDLNSLIISKGKNGGANVIFPKSENENYPEEYWKLDEFYKLWFE